MNMFFRVQLICALFWFALSLTACGKGFSPSAGSPEQASAIPEGSTPVPSPVPTPVPTPTPAPSPAPSPANAFPDASTTGYGNTNLKAASNNSISVPGTYSGLSFKGTVTISSSDVTLENCLVSGTSGDYAEIIVNGNLKNIVIQNCEIAGAGKSGHLGLKGIYIIGNSQVTVSSCNIHDIGAGIELGEGQVIVENSYIHDLNAGADTHYDGIFYGGGAGSDFSLLIQGNHIYNQNGQTDAVMIQNMFGAVNNVKVNNNLLRGGGYTVYADGSKTKSAITNVSFTNNKMGAGQYGYWDLDRGQLSSQNYTVINQGNTDWISGKSVD